MVLSPDTVLLLLLLPLRFRPDERKHISAWALKPQEMFSIAGTTDPGKCSTIKKVDELCVCGPS